MIKIISNENPWHTTEIDAKFNPSPYVVKGSDTYIFGSGFVRFPAAQIIIEFLASKEFGSRDKRFSIVDGEKTYRDCSITKIQEEDKGTLGSPGITIKCRFS